MLPADAWPLFRRALQLDIFRNSASADMQALPESPTETSTVTAVGVDLATIADLRETLATVVYYSVDGLLAGISDLCSGKQNAAARCADF